MLDAADYLSECLDLDVTEAVRKWLDQQSQYLHNGLSQQCLVLDVRYAAMFGF